MKKILIYLFLFVSLQIFAETYSSEAYFPGFVKVTDSLVSKSIKIPCYSSFPSVKSKGEIRCKDSILYQWTGTQWLKWLSMEDIQNIIDTSVVSLDTAFVTGLVHDSVQANKFTNANETDQIYATDSGSLKTTTREWNASIAKDISTNDTTRWGQGGTGADSTDGTFLTLTQSNLINVQKSDSVTGYYKPWKIKNLFVSKSDSNSLFYPVWKIINLLSDKWSISDTTSILASQAYVNSHSGGTVDTATLLASKDYSNGRFQTKLTNPVTSNSAILPSGNLLQGKGANLTDSTNINHTGNTTTFGTATNGGNVNIKTTLGTELAPALTGVSGVNWTFATVYTTPLAGTIAKVNDGLNTITPTAATTIEVNKTYRVIIVVSEISVGNGATWTLGGVAGTPLTTANTYTNDITTLTTGKIIITPTPTATRFVITSISIKLLTDNTGDLSVSGNLKLSSPIQSANGVNAITINPNGNLDLPAYSTYPSIRCGGNKWFYASSNDLYFGDMEAGSLRTNLCTGGAARVIVNGAFVGIGAVPYYYTLEINGHTQIKGTNSLILGGTTNADYGGSLYYNSNMYYKPRNNGHLYISNAEGNFNPLDVTTNGRVNINGSFGLNKDSIPITTGKIWAYVPDTITGQVKRQLLPVGVSSGSASTGYVNYSGTTIVNGQWFGGNTAASGTLRLTYNGYLYAPRMETRLNFKSYAGTTYSQMTPSSIYTEGTLESTGTATFRGIAYVGSTSGTGATANLHAIGGTSQAASFSTSTNLKVWSAYKVGHNSRELAYLDTAKLAIEHLKGITGTPTDTLKAGSGTGGSLTFTTGSNDMAGEIVYTTGTTCTSGIQFVIAFNRVYSVAPFISITPSNSNAGYSLGDNKPYVEASTTGFKLYFNVGGNDETIYKYHYHVIQ